TDDFFDLGGHSLLATVAVARIGAALGVHIPLKLLFLNPTVAALAAQIDGGAAEAAPPAPAARPRSAAAIPLSAAQRRLYFLEQLVPDTATYNVAEAATLKGQLDEEALGRALETVVHRHDLLRAVFRDDDGVLEQVIDLPAPVPLPLTDLSGSEPAERDQEVARFLRIQATRPFDLRTGPLLRARLVRLAPDLHVLLLVIHHVVTDGWSMDVLRRELTAAYNAFTAGGAPDLPQLSFSFADYVAWELEYASGERLSSALDYWRDHLRELPAVLPLPQLEAGPATSEEPDLALRPNAGASSRVAIPPELAEQVRALARRAGATPHAVLLSAYALLLGRMCGLERLIVGCTATGRPTPELEALIGFFVATMPLRADLLGDPTATELTVRMRDEVLSGVSHQEAQLEQIVAALNAPRVTGRAPLLQVAFSLAPGPEGEERFSGLECAWEDIETGTAKFELALLLWERAGGFDGRLEFDVRKFSGGEAESLAQSYLAVLQQLAANPEGRLSELGLSVEPSARPESTVPLIRPAPRPGDGRPIVPPRTETEQRIAA
ncbi:MAG TPA: condensation domain-containing protein, partial [Longimicrobiales bacterium]